MASEANKLAAFTGELNLRPHNFPNPSEFSNAFISDRIKTKTNARNACCWTETL